MQTTVIEDAEEASLSVAAVCEMAATMNETYEKMMRIPMHLYGEYYLHEKAKHDPTPVTMRHDGWKMQEWDESFESLKDRLVFVVAAFLTARPLRFSRKPNLREIGAVQLELVRQSLPRDFAYCEDFKEMCARFRKFNRWEGHIMKLDYNRYGKYLLQNYHKMTDEERQAFFDLDLMVELINEDIRRVEPVEEKEATLEKGMEKRLLPPELSSRRARRIFARAVEARLLTADYQRPSDAEWWKMACMADVIGEELSLSNKWVVFCSLWGNSNLRKYNTDKQGMTDYNNFRKILRSQIL